MSGRVTGEAVLVTGAGQGQGSAEARLLAGEGATVIGVGPADVPDLPGIDYRRLDVTDGEGWAALADVLGKRHGRVDGLVAHAGLTGRARLGELDPADLARVQGRHVGGALRAVQAVLPLVPAGGSIAVVGSAAALTGHHPVAYTASKWAPGRFTKAACLELGARDPRRRRREVDQ